jgi:hypothetical protein
MGEEVALIALAPTPGVQKSTVSQWVKRAVAGGWLMSNETRKGHDARLARGAPPCWTSAYSGAVRPRSSSALDVSP